MFDVVTWLTKVCRAAKVTFEIYGGTSGALKTYKKSNFLTFATEKLNGK